MKKLKDYLCNQEKIWIDINKEDFSLFLKYAKENGCVWGNDKTIEPHHDKCFYYMSINNQLKLTFVSAYCWYIRASNSPPKYKFRELLGEK